MTRAYIGIGSNIDPERNVRDTLRLLARRVPVLGLSTVYLSESIPPGNPPFVNGVLAVEASGGPRALKLGILREIERAFGRTRQRDRNAPRTIDCDLLVYGNEVVHEPDLVLPAPDVRERRFVAVPLLELAPDLVLPGSSTSLASIVAALPAHPMVPLGVLTAALRAEFGDEKRLSRE